mgnify:CR=1 FL=1
MDGMIRSNVRFFAELLLIIFDFSALCDVLYILLNDFIKRTNRVFYEYNICSIAWQGVIFLKFAPDNY